MFTFDDIKMMYDWGCFTDEIEFKSKIGINGILGK